MDLSYYRTVAANLILDTFPEEWESEETGKVIHCGEVIDPKAALNPRHDQVTSKIKHLEILQEEIECYCEKMDADELTIHVRKHCGTLHKDLKEILRQEYLPMLASRIDWAVADRFDRAGFLVCYNKQTDRLQVKVGESAIEL